MTGVNHAATGAVIALVVKQPLLALPLSFCSHFILDALPHFGLEYDRPTNHHILRRVVLIDGTATISLIALLTALTNSWLVLLCMLATLIPDSVWFLKYGHDKRHGRHFSLPQDIFSRFHKKIQWGEHRHGWVIETIWLILALGLLSNLI